MDSHATWEEGACPRAPVSAQGEDPTTLATGVWPLGEGISYPPEPTGSPTVPINPRREWRPNPTGEMRNCMFGRNPIPTRQKIFVGIEIQGSRTRTRGH